MKNKHYPPPIISWVLKTFFGNIEYDDLISDIIKRYGEKVETSGKRFSNIWLMNQIIRSFPYLIRDKIKFIITTFWDQTLLLIKFSKSTKYYFSSFIILAVIFFPIRINNSFINSLEVRNAKAKIKYTEKIIFHVADEIARKSAIWWMDVDGSNQEQLTDNKNWDRAPDITPDGKTIVFESFRNDRWDIYSQNIDGTDLKNLTKGMYGKPHNPAISPDGTKIAFDNFFEDGFGWDIYIMDINGKNRKRLTQEFGDSNRPIWASNGEIISYSKNFYKKTMTN